MFSCLVAGHPTPDVAWTKNDIELNITANSRLSGFDKDKNHSLTVTNVEQLDAGKYRCVGSNILGNSTSSPATLTVQCECKFSFSSKHPSNKGFIVIFRC